MKMIDLLKFQKRLHKDLYECVVAFSKTPELLSIDFENIDKIVVCNNDLYHCIRLLIDTKMIKLNTLEYRCELEEYDRGFVEGEKIFSSWLFRYDDKGKKIFSKYDNDEPTEFYYTYDDKGRLINKKSSDGNTTEYTYDNNSNRITEKHSHWCIESFEKIYDENNNMISKRTSSGKWFEYVYDNNNRVVCEINKNTDRLLKCSYDDNGNKIKIEIVDKDECNNNVFVNEYDKYNNKIKTFDTKKNCVYVYEYDENGIFVDDSVEPFNLNGFEITYKQ